MSRRRGPEPARELHSHGLRELAAIESSRGSYEEAGQAISRITGARLGKRQLEQLAARSAADFESFYSQPARSRAAVTDGDLLVLSADGKGIVMRPDALRPATAKAAGQATAKLATRLSKGEKRNRKRMAEVGAVHDLTPVARTATDIIGRDDDADRPATPKASNKWLTASVVDNAATVIASIFEEEVVMSPSTVPQPPPTLGFQSRPRPDSAHNCSLAALLPKRYGRADQGGQEP